MTTPFARISITLPARDLAAADRLAAQQDRSRSWIVAEAIRRYAAAVEAEVEHEVGMVTGPVMSGTVAGPGPGLGASRLVQLDRDLAMTAADRVRAAEAAVDEVAVRGGPPGAIEEPRWFGSYEDFATWRRGHGDGTAPERLDPSAEAYLRRLDEIARDLKAAGVTGLTEQLRMDRR